MSHELESWTRIGATLWAQSGVVLLLGWLAAKMSRRRGPVAQMMVLRAALAGVAVVAVLSLVAAGRVRTAWRVQLPQFSPSQTVALAHASSANDADQNVPTMQMNDANAPNLDEAASPAISSNDALTDAESSTRFSAPTSPEAVTSNIAQVATTPHAQRFGVYQIVAIIWACGALMLLSWLLFCSVRIALLRRQSAVVTSGLWHQTLGELCANGKSRQPVLLQSAQVRSPFLMGLWHPAIVLPADELISDESSVRAVLLHELTHWRRRDLWWNLAARIIGTVLWPQPLLWIVGRETERVAEEVCDLVVVQGGCEAKDYARCLLDLSERLTLRPVERTVAVGVVPRQSALGNRVKRILDVSRRQEMTISRRVRVVAAVLTLGAIGLSVSLVSVEAKDENAPEQSSPRSSTRKVDLSSPESAVRSMVRALNAKDLDAAVLCVEDAAPLVNPALQNAVRKAPFSVTASDFKTQITGITARVTFRETAVVPPNPATGDATHNHRVTAWMVRHQGAWRIVPQHVSRSPIDESFFEQAAEMLAAPAKAEMIAWAKIRGKAQIVGRVVNDEGKPVAGAVVNVSMSHSDIAPPFRRYAWTTEFLNIAPRIARLLSQNVKTAQDGTFRINGLTSARYDIRYGLSLQTELTTMRMPQLVATSRPSVSAREGSSTRSPDLKLTRGGLVDVHVIDRATRRPVSAPVVLTFSRNGREVLTYYKPTSENGHAVFRAPVGQVRVAPIFQYLKKFNGMYIVSLGALYTPVPKAGAKAGRRLYSSYSEGQSVQVRRDHRSDVRYALQRYVPPKTASASDIRAMNQAETLKKWAKNRGAAEIVGRVVREDGKPAANIPLSVQMTDRTAIKGLGSDPIMTLMAGKVPTTLRDLFFQNSKTDDNGNFQIRGLTTARYQISAHLDERAWQKDGVSVSEMVALNSPIIAARERSSTRSPEITLTSGGLMNVQIVDDATDKPLPLVFLAVQSWPGNAQKPSYYNRTNAEGRVVFRVRPGEVRIFMGFANASGAKRSVVASNGKFYNLQPAKVLGGKIPPANFGGTIATVTKDQTANVQIRLKIYVAPIPAPTPPIQPLTRADGVLTGRVVYENGRPASNIRVSAVMQKAARWEVLRSARLAYGNFGEPASARRWQQVRGRIEQSTLTRNDGTFQFSGLTTAPYNIYVNNTDERFFLRTTSPWVAKAVEGAWARDGQTVRRAQPLVLTRGSLVRGRVLDSKSGQPLGGVILAYEGPQNPTSSESVIFIKSDADGRFTARLASGTTKLYVAGPNVYTGNFVFADTKARDLDTYRVRTSRGTYGVMSHMQYNLDNGAIQSLKKWGDHISIEAQENGVHALTIRLRRLLPAPNAH